MAPVNLPGSRLVAPRQHPHGQMSHAGSRRAMMAFPIRNASHLQPVLEPMVDVTWRLPLGPKLSEPPFR